MVVRRPIGLEQSIAGCQYKGCTGPLSDPSLLPQQGSADTIKASEMFTGTAMLVVNLTLKRMVWFLRKPQTELLHVRMRDPQL